MMSDAARPGQTSGTAGSRSSRRCVGLRRLGRFVLRVAHFAVQHAFLAVALIAFANIPLDVLREMHEGPTRRNTVSETTRPGLVLGFLDRDNMALGQSERICSPTPVMQAPKQDFAQTCHDCNTLHNTGCYRVGFEDQKFDGENDPATLIRLNYSFELSCQGYMRVEYHCVNAHAGAAVPNTLAWINIAIGVVGGVIALHGFIMNLRLRFGSFRYYQQMVQHKRRLLFQGFLIAFAVLTFFYAAAYVYVALSLNEVHVQTQVNIGLMFLACIAGLGKGFDLDPDYYLLSERDTRGRKRKCGCCCRREAGCRSTPMSELTAADDVLLFDSIGDLLGNPLDVVFLVESAAACYWHTGRIEPLQRLVRGNSREDAIRLCRAGGLLERRMLTEANAAKKELEQQTKKKSQPESGMGTSSVAIELPVAI